jgi:pyruvate kinase
MIKKFFKTKIVATIGPSTWDPAVLKQMFQNGMQVARINASFADYNEIKRVTKLIRDIDPTITVMLDTMGHKIRVTGFEDDKNIKTGDELIIIPSTMEAQEPNEIKVTYNTLHKVIRVGAPILIDDGNIVTEVTKIESSRIYVKVIAGGILKKRKTLNTPGTHLDFPELTEKDKEDIRAGVEVGVDMIAASFVRDTNDIRRFKEEITDDRIKIIAKIEDVEGVANFDSILQAVDGIIVARGDLGVEIPLEKVPHLQKSFIKKCREAGKISIVATQMLESMTTHQRPTRAEVTDVSNAVLDGTDALMLSAETSTGEYPVEAVTMMSKIAEEAEQYLNVDIVRHNTNASLNTDILCYHASEIANETDVKGVIVLTKTGATIRSLARHRLQKPIWAITPSKTLSRQLMMYYGVNAFTYDLDKIINKGDVIRDLVNICKDHGLISDFDQILVLTGRNLHKSHMTRILEIVDVDKIPS